MKAHDSEITTNLQSPTRRKKINGGAARVVLVLSLIALLAVLSRQGAAARPARPGRRQCGTHLSALNRVAYAGVVTLPGHRGLEAAMAKRPATGISNRSSGGRLWNALLPGTLSLLKLREKGPKRRRSQIRLLI